MSNNRSSFGGVLGISLAIGLVVSSWVVSRTFVDIKKFSQVIEVKGYAETRVVSKQATWVGTVTVRDGSLSTASRKLSQDRDKVIKVLESQHLGGGKIVISPPSKRVIYALNSEGHSTNEIEKFEVTQDIRIDSDDIEALTSCVNSLDKITELGIEFESAPIRYYNPSDELEGLKMTLLGKATQNGFKRAEQFASNSGSKVGRLISARQGLFQVTSPHSGTSDYDSYDTKSKEKIVKVVVTLSYSVEKS